MLASPLEQLIIAQLLERERQAELKERIDRQIIVTKDRSGGSRVQVQA